MKSRYFTEEQLEAALIESCERSGVPLKITDPTALAKIASIARDRRGQAEAS